MNLNKLVAFLHGLKRHTDEGTLEWREDFPDCFSIDVKSVRVTLSVSRNADSIDEDYFVTLDALPEGATIVSYGDADLRGDFRGSFEFMKGLYNDARMSARGYKKKLDEALDAFSDDIPF